MKRFITLALCAVFALGASACGKTPDGAGLMAGASPATSALQLCVWDGEKSKSAFLYDGDTIRQILDELNAVKAKKVSDWSPGDASAPIYGLEIGGADGSPLDAAWSNGYWITQDGTAYAFDFDFAALEKDFPWKNETETDGFHVPCARCFARDQNGWHTEYLSPAAELEPPPEGVTMTQKSRDGDQITVTLVNHSGAEWDYGASYAVQVLLSGAWYDIPSETMVCFDALLYRLSDGAEQDKIYYTWFYGDLPSGTYRIAANGLTAEFTEEN